MIRVGFRVNSCQEPKGLLLFLCADFYTIINGHPSVTTVAKENVG